MSVKRGKYPARMKIVEMLGRAPGKQVEHHPIDEERMGDEDGIYQAPVFTLDDLAELMEQIVKPIRDFQLEGVTVRERRPHSAGIVSLNAEAGVVKNLLYDAPNRARVVVQNAGADTGGTDGRIWVATDEQALASAAVPTMHGAVYPLAANESLEINALCDIWVMGENSNSSDQRVVAYVELFAEGAVYG